MKNLEIFVLIALSAIAKGNLFAAARGLAQPIILSIGTIFASLYGNSNNGDGNTIDTAFAPLIWKGYRKPNYGNGSAASWKKRGKGDYLKWKSHLTEKWTPEKTWMTDDEIRGESKEEEPLYPTDQEC